MSTRQNTPLVSIMMTTYNRAEYIGEAISSILAQTYQNWELLVLDDGSIDETERIVKTFADERIHWFPVTQNLGITKNRNRGFQYATGKYVAVLDSDDVWLSADKLEKQVAFLNNNPDCVVVGTFAKTINDSSKETDTLTYPTDNIHIRQTSLLRNPFVHSSVLIRQGFVTEKEPYDISIPIWEDYDLFLRLGTRGKLANIPLPMTGYRFHSGNISKEKRMRGVRTHLQIIKRHKTHYPNYLLALIKGYLRFIL